MTSSAPPHTPRRPPYRLERLVLLAGIGLLCVLFYQLDPSVVLQHIQLVGWGMLLIIAQETLAYLANALGWYLCLPHSHRHIPFAQVFAARIAGDAVNYITPTANVGGEFIRTRFLRPHAPTTVLVASVTIAKISQALGQVAFILIGLFFVIRDIPMPVTIERGILLSIGLLTIILLALLWGQRRGTPERGVFMAMWQVIARTGVFGAQPPKFVHALQPLDTEIAQFYRHAHGSFIASVLCFFTGWALGTVEIYLLLYFLDLPVTWHMAITIEVLSVAIDGMFFFVPAKAGTQEAGKVFIFTALGLDPVKGLSLGILRRVRELVWSVVGMALLSRRHISLRQAGV